MAKKKDTCMSHYVKTSLSEQSYTVENLICSCDIAQGLQ